MLVIRSAGDAKRVGKEVLAHDLHGVIHHSTNISEATSASPESIREIILLLPIPAPRDAS